LEVIFMPQKGYTDIIVLSLMDDLLEVYDHIPSLFVATKSILAYNEARSSGLEIEVEKYHVSGDGGRLGSDELDREWESLGLGGSHGRASNEFYVFNRQGALVEAGYKVSTGIFRMLVVDPHNYSKTDYASRQHLLDPERTEGTEQMLGLDVIVRPTEANGYGSEIFRDFGRKDRLTPVEVAGGPLDREGFHRMEIYVAGGGKDIY
jgi:hypothetical protein